MSTQTASSTAQSKAEDLREKMERLGIPLTAGTETLLKKEQSLLNYTQGANVLNFCKIFFNKNMTANQMKENFLNLDLKKLPFYAELTDISVMPQKLQKEALQKLQETVMTNATDHIFIPKDDRRRVKKFFCEKLNEQVVNLENTLTEHGLSIKQLSAKKDEIKKTSILNRRNSFGNEAFKTYLLTQLIGKGEQKTHMETTDYIIVPCHLVLTAFRNDYPTLFVPHYELIFSKEKINYNKELPNFRLSAESKITQKTKHFLSQSNLLKEKQ